jgi:hypothetical protein
VRFLCLLARSPELRSSRTRAVGSSITALRELPRAVGWSRTRRRRAASPTPAPAWKVRVPPGPTSFAQLGVSPLPWGSRRFAFARSLARVLDLRCDCLVPALANRGFGVDAFAESMRKLGLGEDDEAGEEKLPERPGEADCTYYLRTGACGYGERCRYNHPRDRPAPVSASLTHAASLSACPPTPALVLCQVLFCSFSFVSCSSRWLLVS